MSGAKIIRGLQEAVQYAKSRNETGNCLNQGWSSMSSAPRDRPILARRHNDCFFEYHVVWWSDDHTYPWASDNNAFPSDRLDDWHEIPE